MIDLRIIGSGGPLHQPYINDTPLQAPTTEVSCPFLFIDEVCYQVLEFNLKIRPGKVPVELYARGLLAVDGSACPEPLSPVDCAAYLEAKPPRGSKSVSARLQGFDVNRLRSFGRVMPGLSYLEVSMKPGKPLEIKLIFAPESINFSLEGLSEIDLDFADVEDDFDLDNEACSQARQDFLRDNADALELLGELD